MYFKNENFTNYYSSPRRQLLANTIRRLWMEHVMWTREFIKSAAFNSPDIDAVTSRLLRNPSDFANLLRPFFGTQNTMIFENLLTDHLEIAAQLVKAAKAGDSAGAAEQRKKWYLNADEIAAFLHDINPCWSRKIWQDLFYEHLRMTEDEAVQILTGQYEASTAQFGAIEDEVLKMADYMVRGIVRRFEI
jgi:hypothetical protein